MDVGSETGGLRPCKTCRVRFLSVSDPARFQNCASCRAQNRAKDTRRLLSPPEATPRNAKQKSAQTFQELEMKAKQAATRLAPATVSEGGTSQEVRQQTSKRGPRVEPFESTTDMYEALIRKAFDNDKLLEFYGVVYHLVHVKTIDHEVRVMGITTELVNFAHLLFDEEGDSDTEIGDCWYSRTYPCRCRSSIGEDCHGKVEVTAETNEFFSGGIARQTTTVRVYHA